MHRFECKKSDETKVLYSIGDTGKPDDGNVATTEAIAPDAPVTFNFLRRKIFSYDSTLTLFNSRLKKDWDGSQNIQALMDELKDNGPLLVLGQFGPENYEEDALLQMKQQIEDTVIHAFKKGSFIGGSNAMATVIGAGIDENNGPYVLLTLRGKKAESSDAKCIMMTFERFNEAIAKTASLKFDPVRCAALKQQGTANTEEVHASNGSRPANF